MKRWMQKRIGRRWGAKGASPSKQWFEVPALLQYMDDRICPKYETGVPGAVRKATDGATLGSAISIGAGHATKELRLVEAGLVGHFELFDLSQARADVAAEKFRDKGLTSRMDYVVGDAFAHSPVSEHDLVYWDQALHHMLDVDEALAWSVRALKPNGLLVINDYVGPNRLQFTRREVEYARRFLQTNAQSLRAPVVKLRPKTIFDRIKIMIKDPSEAPQSEKIMDLFHKHTGQRMRPLGGAMLQLCTRFLPLDASNSLYRQLTEWDDRAVSDGIWHFAFGLWAKPKEVSG